MRITVDKDSGFTLIAEDYKEEAIFTLLHNELKDKVMSVRGFESYKGITTAMIKEYSVISIRETNIYDNMVYCICPECGGSRFKNSSSDSSIYKCLSCGHLILFDVRVKSLDDPSLEGKEVPCKHQYVSGLPGPEVKCLICGETFKM